LKKLKFNINASLATFGAFKERYVPEGYFKPKDLEQTLEAVSKIDRLNGLGVWYPGHPLIENPDKLKKKFNEYGLRVADICPELWGDKKWKHGAFSTHEKKIRKEAVKIAKATMDLALELDAYSVLIWPAHDGFDYVFESDYVKAYDYFIESLEEIAAYNPGVKLAIEYKQKDPRAKSYIEDIGKALYIIKCIKADNIGVALDLGHSLFAQERPAESLALLEREDKLYQIHLNDNYRDADPDLVFGSINFWDTLEMFYWLGKYGFDGWLNIDTSSPRNDPLKMLKLSVNFIEDFESLAEKLLCRQDRIGDNLAKNNFVDNMSLIREVIFKNQAK